MTTIAEKTFNPFAVTEASKTYLRPIHFYESDFVTVDISNDEENFFLDVIVAETVEKESEEEGLLQTLSGLKLRHVVDRYPSWQSGDIYRRIPGYTLVRGEKHKVPVTDITVILLSSLVGPKRLVFLSQAAKEAYQYVLYKTAIQSTKAQIQAKFKQSRELPSIPKEYTAREGKELADYQKLSLALSLGQEGYALFLDRGLGKTAISIARVCVESQWAYKGIVEYANTVANNGDKSKKIYRVLVVCPNQVRTNWSREFVRFATVPGKVTIIKGPKEKRFGLLANSLSADSDKLFSATVVGYDTLSVDWKMYTLVKWDLIIADESHYFKSSKTNRWTALKKLRDRSVKRMVLTGTEMANSVLDYYTQLEFLYEGACGFSSFQSFQKFHCRFEAQYQATIGNQVKKIVGVANVPLLQERLSRVSVKFTKQEAGLDLPDKVYDTHEVEMTPAQTKVYKELAKDLYVKLKTDIEASENRELSVKNALVQLLRLSQIASGFVVWDAVIDPNSGEVIVPAKLERFKDNPKIDALKEMLTDPDLDPNEKTVIWSVNVDNLIQISESLTEWGIKHGLYYGAVKEGKRQDIIDSFNNDADFKVLVGNPQTAGTGLNLLGHNPDRDDQETYCGHNIYYACNWSMIQRSQSEDRSHRRGTKMPVRITDLIVPDTIDQEIRERVIEKQEAATIVSDISQILEGLVK